jgi:hypothetical protein
MTKPRVRVVTRPQGRALLDRVARAELQMTGAQFVRRWKAGKFGRQACSPAVMRVAMLLPFAR